MFPDTKRAVHALTSRFSLALLAGAVFAVTSTSFANPGDLYVTELATGSVVVYTPGGVGTTFDTGLTSPQGIAFDQVKNLYVVDAGDGTAGTGTIFKYDLSGGSSRTPFLTGLNNPRGLVLDGSNLLVSDNLLSRVLSVPLNGSHPIVFQLIPTPMGLAAHGLKDGTGTYRYIANGPILREISPTAVITDFDFSVDGSRAATVDESGDEFTSTDTGSIFEILVGGGTRKLFASGFTQPTGMDFRPAKFTGDTDRVGYLYVADTTTGTISQISQTGTVTPFVTGAGMPNYVVFETAGAPVVVTGSASDITATGATLNGTVNPDGNPTTYHFDYGLTTAYGSTTTPTNAGSGTSPVAVNASVTGLTTGTLYHFRISATNGSGTTLGEDNTFTPSAAATPTPTPIVVTGSASLITNTTATLNGTVNPSGSDTTYQFEYGLTTAYGSTSTATGAGNGFTPVPATAALTGLSSGMVYHFRLNATNTGGTANGADATFTTTSPTPPDSALNISTRIDVETNDNVGIGGFIITGTNARTVAIRGIGPSLASGSPPVAGALSDPLLELHDSTGAIIATNDNWMDNSTTDQMTLTDNGLAPSNSLESALVQTLNPGAYTAILKGSHGETGVGLVEVYNLTSPSIPGELANLSTRGFVGTSDNVLIGGVILGPPGGLDATVVVRAIGPSLANAVPPVPDPLIDPVLELRNVNGDLIATNDNWQTDAPPDDYAAQVTAAGLAPTAAAESAVYADLVAGNYTAIVSGKNGTTGVGLVEVYHVPPVMAKSADK